MVSWGAVSIQGTVTRIFAFLIATGQRVRAVRIHQALVGFAVHKWVSLVVLRTVAVGPVILGSAEGIDATLLEQAGILTLSTDAGFVIGAFKVTLAASYKPMESHIKATLQKRTNYWTDLTLCADPVGISFKATAAGTHSPVVLDLTVCIGATSEG